MATTTNFSLEVPTPGGYRNTWGGTLNTTITKIDELVHLAMPLGTIQMWPVATAPTATTNGGAWLLCDGASISRTAYADLFALLGTAYGSVDGNTFNVPDMRSRSPVGYNTATITGRATRAIAASGGEEAHALTEAELDAHAHALPSTAHKHSITDKSHSHIGANSGKTADASLTVTDGGHSHTTEMVSSWGGGPDYRAEWGPGPTASKHDVSSNSATTGITIPDHSHSFTTTTVETGITETENNVTGITTTNETGSNTAHNTMHPFLVLNYIILAKHPSF